MTITTNSIDLTIITDFNFRITKAIIIFIFVTVKLNNSTKTLTRSTVVLIKSTTLVIMLT